VRLAGAVDLPIREQHTARLGQPDEKTVRFRYRQKQRLDDSPLSGELFRHGQGRVVAHDRVGLRVEGDPLPGIRLKIKLNRRLIHTSSIMPETAVAGQAFPGGHLLDARGFVIEGRAELGKYPPRR
jgi:hypothetical protein